MRRVWVALLAFPLLAASPPQRQLSLGVPRTDMPLFGATAPAPVAPRTNSNYAPAPLPNRDVTGPQGPRASNAPSFSPSLFTRSDQYRGEAFFPGSTAQSEQEKRAKPAAGLSLHMPLTDQ